MNEQNRSTDSFLPVTIFFVIVGVVLWGVFALQPRPATSSRQPAALPTATPLPISVAASPTPAAAAATAAAMVAMEQSIAAMGTGDAAAGELIFQGTCAACHGFNAQGIEGLGKNLVASEFVAGQTDAQLVAFLIQGRAVDDPLNTTGILMPPRGGNPALKDADLLNVVTYIRSLQGAAVVDAGAPEPLPTAAPSVNTGAWVAPDINALDISVLSPSFGASGALDFASADGKSLYLWACSGCHGIDGQGTQLSGTRLSGSTLSDEALMQLLTESVPPTAPLKTFTHPARGGYPTLNDEQIQQLVDYLHTLTD